MKNNVRYYRKKKFLTQSELGTLIGVQSQTIGNIENSKHMPRPKTIRALADALGVSAEKLFSQDESEAFPAA